MAATIMTPEVKSRKAAAIQQRINTLEANLADLRQILVLAEVINGRKK